MKQCLGACGSCRTSKSRHNKPKNKHIRGRIKAHRKNDDLPHWKNPRGMWICVVKCGNVEVFAKQSKTSPWQGHIYAGEIIDAEYHPNGWFEHHRGWSLAGTALNPYFIPAKSKQGRAAMSRSVAKFYKIGKKLGEGAFAAVRMAERISDGKKFAIKIIDKTKLDELDIEHLYDETDVMRRLKHKHTCELIDIFDTETKLMLVLELLLGGDLLEDIEGRGNEHFSEAEAAEIAVSVADALRYMHCMNIAHRDLKPANLVYTSKGPDKILKVTDFGLSSQQRIGMRTICGTDSHMAPEILSHKVNSYGAEVDLWSLGIILYTLLSGTPPFWGNTIEELHQRILSGKYSMEGPSWEAISPNFKKVIKGLLTVDPKKRWTAEQIVNYHWDVSGMPLGKDHMRRLRITKAKMLFRENVRAVIAMNRFVRALKYVVQNHLDQMEKKRRTSSKARSHSKTHQRKSVHKNRSRTKSTTKNRSRRKQSKNSRKSVHKKGSRNRSVSHNSRGSSKSYDSRKRNTSRGNGP